MKKISTLALVFLTCQVAYLGVSPTVAFGSSLNSPSFGITVSPRVNELPQGAPGNFTITLTSLNGYVGNVTLSASPNYVGHAVSIDLAPTRLPLSPNRPYSVARLSVAWKACDYCLDYETIAIDATDGSITQYALAEVAYLEFFITVQTRPFCNASECSVSALQMAQSSSTLLYVDVDTPNGYIGNVTLTAAVSPPGPSVTFSPSTIHRVEDKIAEGNLTLSTNEAATGSYIVNVTGSDGYSSHSTQFALRVGSSGDSGYSVPFLFFIGSMISVGIVVSLYVFRRITHAKGECSEG